MWTSVEPVVIDAFQLFSSLLSDSMTSHLQSLGVASGDIHRLLERAANLSTVPTDDVSAATTSRLVAETRQLVLNISATPISDDHVTEMYRTAETGRLVAEQTLNVTQRALYAVTLYHCSYLLYIIINRY